MVKRIIIILCFIYVCLVSHLYGYEIKGRVIDSITKDPLEGIPIVVDNVTNYSEKQGQFLIKTEKKDVNLSIQIPGYNKFQKFFTYPYTFIEIKLELATEFSLQKIYIREKVDRMEGSKQKLTSDEIKKTTTHLFSDSLKIVQTLPGVVTGNDFSSLMYIRGGEFYESLSFLDNIVITEPYIWGGMQSVFNPSFLDSIEFYSGGFPVKYPQALSGIIDVRNIEGDYGKTRGFLELSAATFEGFIQGPIKKESASYVFGIRRTHYDLIANLLSKNKNIVFPFFYDAQSKITWKINKQNKIYFNTITSYEGMNFDIPEQEEDVGGGEFHYRDLRFLPGLNWEKSFGDKLMIITTTSYRYQKGNYDYTGNDSSYSEVIQKVNEFFLSSRINYTPHRHHVEMGSYVFVRGVFADMSSKFRTLMLNGSYITNTEKELFDWRNFTFTGVYLQDDINLISDWLYFNLGGLLEYMDYTRDRTFSYRGGLKVFLTETTTLKLMSGLYSQVPSAGINGPPPFIENRNIKSEQAWHYIIGIEQNFFENFFFHIEGYWKDYFNRVVKDPDFKYTNNGLRKAYGIDVFLQKKISGKWDGWLTYTYLHSRDKIKSRSNPEEFDQSSLNYLEPVGEWFLSNKERTHNISLILNYAFTEKWKIAITYRYSTGLPYTPVIGANQYVDTYVPIHGEYLSERLPDYSRLDIKLNMPSFNKHVTPFIQTINTLNHKNVDSYYYNKSYTQRKESLTLPFLIIAGVRYEF